MLKDTGRRFETEELNEFSLDGFMMERVQPTCRVSNPRWPIRTGGGIGTVTSAQSAAGVFSQGTADPFDEFSFLALHSLKQSDATHAQPRPICSMPALYSYSLESLDPVAL